MENLLLDSTTEAAIVGNNCRRKLKVGGRFSHKYWQCSNSSYRRESGKALCSTMESNANVETRRRKSMSINDSTRINASIWVAFEQPVLREKRILDAEEDEYGGIIINPERLPQDPNDFAFLLHSSLSSWKKDGKKGVWLKLPTEFSELVPVAVKGGFKYHHAEESYVMLTCWLQSGPSMLPANASHQVGVGSFVINDHNEVLVVQENYCPTELRGSWKIPTGFIQEAEEIFSGAVREVKEETGVDTEFEEVIAFRHAHKLAFEKSDLFFICMMRPLTNEIKVDDAEIHAAKWMPLDEFMEQPSIQEDNMFSRIIKICMARVHKRYCGLKAYHVVSKFDARSSSLYYNVRDHSDSECLASDR